MKWIFVLLQGLPAMSSSTRLRLHTTQGFKGLLIAISAELKNLKLSIMLWVRTELRVIYLQEEAPQAQVYDHWSIGEKALDDKQVLAMWGADFSTSMHAPRQPGPLVFSPCSCLSRYSVGQAHPWRARCGKGWFARLGYLVFQGSFRYHRSKSKSYLH